MAPPANVQYCKTGYLRFIKFGIVSMCEDKSKSCGNLHYILWLDLSLEHTSACFVPARSCLLVDRKLCTLEHISNNLFFVSFQLKPDNCPNVFYQNHRVSREKRAESFGDGQQFRGCTVWFTGKFNIPPLISSQPHLVCRNI